MRWLLIDGHYHNFHAMSWVSLSMCESWKPWDKKQQKWLTALAHLLVAVKEPISWMDTDYIYVWPVQYSLACKIWGKHLALFMCVADFEPFVADKVWTVGSSLSDGGGSKERKKDADIKLNKIHAKKERRHVKIFMSSSAAGDNVWFGKQIVLREVFSFVCTQHKRHSLCRYVCMPAAVLRLHISWNERMT